MIEQKENPWDVMARNMCFTDEKEMLTSLYENNSIAKIAILLNCGTATVQRRIGLYNLTPRKRGGPQTRSNLRYLLFHIDQRLVMNMGLTKLANRIRSNPSSVYKYRKYKAGFDLKGE